MSVTRSEFGRAISDRRDENFVIVKMNMPRRFKVAPGTSTESQGDLSNTKRFLNRDLVVNKSDKDRMTRNDTASEFATVTVNLLSQPKPEETEGGQQQRNDNTDDDLAMQDINEEDGSDKEDIKEEEELDETESEDSEHESQFRRSKTPLKTAPSEHVTLVPLLALPNISLACPKCSLNVNICHVRTHRDFHTALQTFKFAQNFRPQTLKTLIKRRKVVIKKLQESSAQNNGKAGFADKNLQKINTAFEILKSELEGTGNAFRVLETELGKVLSVHKLGLVFIKV